MTIQTLLVSLAMTGQINTSPQDVVVPPIDLPTPALVPDGQIVEPQQTWGGTLRDESLRKFAPESGVIPNQNALAALWREWQPEEKPPTINFAESVVLVATIDGPNRMFVNATIDQRGNLRTVVGGTKIGGPGFGYTLVQIPRDGIRTVNGQPIVREPGNAVPPREPVPPQRPGRVNELVRVAIQGRLQTGIVAIGGETTGTVIQANGISFELAFDEPVLHRQVERFADRPVLVTGTLIAKDGVETGRRLIVEVDWIEAANNRRP